MQLTIDADKFDQQQQILVREIIEQIRLKLTEAGINGEQLKDLTGNIAFSVASTIDDTAMIEFDGVEVRPYLTFASDEDELIHGGENSYTHEYVADLINDIFSNKSDE
jgi:hypothetical protein